MRKAIFFFAALFAFVLIGDIASAKLMRPAKVYDTTVSGTITTERMEGKRIYYLTDAANAWVYTLGNRDGEVKEEFVDILQEAAENDLPVRIQGELSIWKDRVLSLEIEEIRYVEE